MTPLETKIKTIQDSIANDYATIEAMRAAEPAYKAFQAQFEDAVTIEWSWWLNQIRFCGVAPVKNLAAEITELLEALDGLVPTESWESSDCPEDRRRVFSATSNNMRFEIIAVLEDGAECQIVVIGYEEKEECETVKITRQKPITRIVCGSGGGE